jgi:GT2 family glycosyltransferase/glycosyltransferase involved in cell wall biosynthesis
MEGCRESTDENRLTAFFRDVSGAVEAGHFHTAMRFADAARRFVPQDLTANLIYARLLLRTGGGQAAADCLRGRPELEGRVLHAEAAFRAGLTEEAARCCSSLLLSFAVDSLGNLPVMATGLCRAHGDEFPGWVGIDSGLRLVGEIRAGSVATIECDNVCLGRIDRASQRGLPGVFSIRVPCGAAGLVRVRVGSRDLLGSPLRWPPDFGAAGWVVQEDQLLSGEVCMNWAPRSAINVVVTSHGSEDTCLQVEPCSRGSIIGSPFSMRLGRHAAQSADVHVSVLLPDGRTAALAGSPIKSLQRLAPMAIVNPPLRTATASVRLSTPPLVNIVVPVYRGLEETLTCLHSVLAHMPADATLTVIDDASPDSALREALDELAREGRITVVRNQFNLGFPGAANRGMRLHRERDVILLNADTEVFEGWLERLVAAAYSAEDIGTVTPLGEAASIASYPAEERQPCSSEEAARIDQIARLVNAGKSVDIPVGVGFCLYVRRRCLEEVGEFDEDAFGRGYGEENDFCLRARRRGWRNVAATDVFVRHTGGRSYGREKDVLTTRNSRVINYRYPGYDRLVAGFIASNALRDSKRAIDRQRLLDSATKPVLLLSFDLAGGVKRHVDLRQATLQASGHTVLILRAVVSPDKKDRVVIAAGTDFRHLVYDLPRDAAELRALLRDLRLTRIEVHHFLELSAPTLEMVAGLGVPYDAFIHDYAWICPRVSLLSGAGVYCGEPAIEACEACVRKNGAASSQPTTVKALRARSRRILAAADRIIAPTRDVRDRLRRYYPELGIEVISWEPPVRPRTPARRGPGGRVRVGLIGAIGTPKGYDVLLECARDAAARALPVEFIVVGYTRDDRTLLQTGRVFVTGPYEESEAAALLERECCDIALFLSLTPETWCYTLTYPLAQGTPIVAFDLGAVSERLRAAGTGVLLPWATPAAAINDTLVRLAADDDVKSAHSVNPESYVNNITTSAGGPMQTNHSNDVGSEPGELSSSVQVLTLPVGIYAFTVSSGGGAPGNGLTLPAFQVAPAPVRSASKIEFLEGPTTLDRWLTHKSDVVTVKISVDTGTLLLTSLRAPDSSVLSIDIRRLDAVESSTPTVEQPAEPAPEPAAAISLRTSTLVHVQNVGDLEFTDGWAGYSADNLWIEAFAAKLPEPPVSDPIEYLGVTYEGGETSWLSDGALCGTRGTGTPLVAFAVRAKQDAGEDYTCIYSGKFLSGSVVGPCTDGSLCRSESDNDPLVAMELRVARRPSAGSPVPG